MNKYFDHFVKNINTIVLMGITFMLAGYLIPHIYYEFIDTTNYYSIKNPVEVLEKEYEPCDTVPIYLVRNSAIDSQGQSIINLNLIKDDSSQERVDTVIKVVSINKGEGQITLNWEIDCNAKAGEYYFGGTMSYKVREFTKYSPFNTVPFTVVASGSARVR